MPALIAARRLLTHSTGGVPSFVVFDGVLHQLLLGSDGQPLQGADGFYLYGRA